MNTQAQTAAVATVHLTKQEQLKNALVAAPTDAKYGTAENRIALVELVGNLYVAKYNDIDVAAVKKVEDLANLLIDKRYTQKAKWADVAELNFLCDVPEGTPNKAGMKKAGGKLAALQTAIVSKIPAELDKASAKDLKAAIAEIQKLLETATAE